MDVARTSPEKKEVLRMTWVLKYHVPSAYLQIRKKYLPSILFQANVKYPNKPFSKTGNNAKKHRGKDCFAVLQVFLEIVVLFYSKIFISCPV